MGTSSTRKWAAAALTSAALVGGLLAAPATAHAEGDFYTPPALEQGGSPGDILRSEPSDLAIRVPTGDGVFPAQGTRLLYRSNNAKGAPNAVSGTYLEPSTVWNGEGPRPLVAVAVGTHGQGDQCAPSRNLGALVQYNPPLDLFTEYELLSINALLLQGIAVVVTDYDGLGTPGHHTYVNRAAEAYAVLDSVRAALNLPGTSLTPDSPVGLYGYSQGGGASGAAAELAPTYAPELNLKGAYVGAPPADLLATLKQIDGTLLTGAVGYTINGLIEAYPEIRSEVEAEINDRGRAMLAAVANQCVPETVATVAFQRTEDFTRTGEPLDVVVGRLPQVQKAIDEQRIGRLTPQIPVLLQHGTQDDTVPYGQGRQLALDWCDNGATVQFDANLTPPILPGFVINHAVPLLTGLPTAVQYLDARLRDAPAPSNCGAF
ncbi:MULTISPECIES: lipase family protein [unclassified Rhodococcus (in: high G+C Gram-positive bacteria)]|uniref:lipase family protein n=1 Tax=unclassified Rhodococcus (in: high G+C Gram-positive bacteria) TaxID=192944 RepID=UPI00146E748B|nr:lipase family protein [Rhodococcus sp. BL-253-APC-6A1W]NMD95603.1 alpha/beta fold hydrolase [Rhodococcus sp. BL-253-APC-6A1W]